ncbi:hypothetical protein EW146_g9656 [Bondarzewia mesenterica]|uniref:Uncharacterized protein n=1 Tax=Bondarzewia mesenterica TaxID=1095465 RepID=A0A4S4L6A3_9AGAM|nr:hypothetical protein EW146_g9656 [Bondarzewia mesenterica]
MAIHRDLAKVGIGSGVFDLDNQYQHLEDPTNLPLAHNGDAKANLGLVSGSASSSTTSSPMSPITSFFLRLPYDLILSDGYLTAMVSAGPVPHARARPSADLRPPSNDPTASQYVTCTQVERVALEIDTQVYKECSALKIKGIDDVFEAATCATMLMREGMPTTMKAVRDDSAGCTVVTRRLASLRPTTMLYIALDMLTLNYFFTTMADYTSSAVERLNSAVILQLYSLLQGLLVAIPNCRDCWQILNGMLDILKHLFMQYIPALSLQLTCMSVLKCVLKKKNSKKEKDRCNAEDELAKAQSCYEETAQDVRMHINMIQQNEID